MAQTENSMTDTSSENHGGADFFPVVIAFLVAIAVLLTLALITVTSVGQYLLPG